MFVAPRYRRPAVIAEFRRQRRVQFYIAVIAERRYRRIIESIQKYNKLFSNAL